jgi:hypothetical protein
MSVCINGLGSHIIGVRRSLSKKKRERAVWPSSKRLTSRNVSLVNHFIFVKSYGSCWIDSGSKMRTVIEIIKEWWIKSGSRYPFGRFSLASIKCKKWETFFSCSRFETSHKLKRRFICNGGDSSDPDVKLKRFCHASGPKKEQSRYSNRFELVQTKVSKLKRLTMPNYQPLEQPSYQFRLFRVNPVCSRLSITKLKFMIYRNAIEISDPTAFHRQWRTSSFSRCLQSTVILIIPDRHVWNTQY